MVIAMYLRSEVRALLAHKGNINENNMAVTRSRRKAFSEPQPFGP